MIFSMTRNIRFACSPYDAISRRSCGSYERVETNDLQHLVVQVKGVCCSLNESCRYHSEKTHLKWHVDYLLIINSGCFQGKTQQTPFHPHKNNTQLLIPRPQKLWANKFPLSNYICLSANCRWQCWCLIDLPFWTHFSHKGADQNTRQLKMAARALRQLTHGLFKRRISILVKLI